MRFASLAALALAATLPAIAPAQVVDEGSFTISRGGTPIGREEFTIRRDGAGAGSVLVAYATVTLDGRRLSPALRADQSGSPLAYQVEVRTGTTLEEKLSGQVGRGRFSSRVRTPAGEAAKEYIVADGALILDENVFHQYYFVARRERGTVPVVIPRRNVQVFMRVTPAGPDRVTVGGTAITARRFELSGPEGTRTIWVDGDGRVLKVALSNGTVALRDSPPR